MWEYKAKVIKVVDGDTIDVVVDLGFHVEMEMRLRLNGINTPEIRTKDLEEKRKGFEAKERVQELVGDKEVRIRTYKEGKYGRMLADVYPPDSEQSLNSILLVEGLAEVY